MLKELERRLATIAQGALTAHPDIAVAQAPAAPTPAAGKGLVRVAVASFVGEGAFEAGAFATRDDKLQRRVLTVQFRALVECFVTPADATAAALIAARELVLDALSLLAYALADAGARQGTAFGADDTLGFAVGSFALAGAEVPRDAPAGAAVSGLLRYRGRATLWPVDVAFAGEPILKIDRAPEVLPLRFEVELPAVAFGGSTAVLVHGLSSARAIAVSVASTLPPGKTGSIDGGTAGAVAGDRVVVPVNDVASFTYRAPPDKSATAAEQIVVYAAHADNARGLLLGTEAVRLHA
ncbi:MAG TPA: hypothetical protein VIW69_03540 [Candidatus Elarobacter sp.]